MAVRFKLLLLVVLLYAAARTGLAQPAIPQPDTAEAPIGSAPVVIDGRTLFDVRGVSAFPAERRAALIETRILELARDPSFDPAQIEISSADPYTLIGTEKRPVMRITEADSEFEGIDRKVLADVYLSRIRDAIASYRASRSAKVLLSSARRAAVATVLVVLALLLVRWLLVYLRRFLERRFAHRVKTVSIRSFEVLRAERIWGILRGVLRLVGGISFAALIVLYLRYTLALFPWTYGAATHIDDWIFSPLAVLWSGFVDKLPNLV